MGKTKNEKKSRALSRSDSLSKCPVTFALDIFGDRWSLLILRDLFFKQKRHYGEFLRSSEKISTNILANRLAMLETEGLLTKTIDPQHHSRFVYGLTDKAKDLLPMMLEMITWSAKYDPLSDDSDCIIVGAPAHLVERWANEPERLLDEILANLQSSDVAGPTT